MNVERNKSAESREAQPEYSEGRGENKDFQAALGRIWAEFLSMFNKWDVKKETSHAVHNILY